MKYLQLVIASETKQSSLLCYWIAAKATPSRNDELFE